MSKCLECLTEHPKGDWPWKKYDKPVYWSLPDDKAPIKCRDCGRALQMFEVILTQIPCGHRLVVCKECIEKDWLELATYLGMFND